MSAGRLPFRPSNIYHPYSSPFWPARDEPIAVPLTGLPEAHRVKQYPFPLGYEERPPTDLSESGLFFLIYISAFVYSPSDMSEDIPYSSPNSSAGCKVTAMEKKNIPSQNSVKR